MHTTRVKDDQGREWAVIHNGDWSGDAHVRRIDNTDDKEKIIEEYTIPGRVIQRACATAVADEIIGLIEQKFC